MRLLFVSSFGCLVAACSLSMNPDLPSAEEAGGAPSSSKGGDIFDDGIGIVTDNDQDGDITHPGGPPAGEGANGSGGSSATCSEIGGAGGLGDQCGGSL